MKKSGISRSPRDFVTFLKRAVPKTLFACTCIETNRLALLPSRSLIRRSN
jgi:hypothetical protein